MNTVLTPNLINNKTLRRSKNVPNFLESKLKTEAAKKGLKGREADRYTYGTLNAIGAMKGSSITPKGRQMQRKHDAHMRTVGLNSMRAA